MVILGRFMKLKKTIRIYFTIFINEILEKFKLKDFLNFIFKPSFAAVRNVNDFSLAQI